jgi:hypothetical protein
MAELRKVQPAHYSPNVTVAQAKRAWMVMERRAPYPDPDAPRPDAPAAQDPAGPTGAPTAGAPIHDTGADA